MFIDEEIDLREDLPERLQRDFTKLQEYYDAGDWFNFDIFFEVGRTVAFLCAMDVSVV